VPVDKQRKSWNRARIAAGLGPEITPHILRHTAVSWAMQGGVSIWDAANYFGMSVQMVENVYGHHHPDFQKHIASRIGRR
jgi:integrase